MIPRHLLQTLTSAKLFGFGSPVLSLRWRKHGAGIREGHNMAERRTGRPFIQEQMVTRRVIGSEDIQMMGMHHGGCMLEFVQEAADIVANQYCNLATNLSDGNHNESSLCSIATLEKAEFLQPLYIGEVAELSGRVVATSKHSLKVHITVHSENSATGVRKLTNRASLWYTSRENSDEATPTEVPPLNGDTPLAAEPRPKSRIVISEGYGAGLDEELHTVNQSQASSMYFFLPIHLGVTDHCRAGPVLRVMDEFGGIMAARYFRYPAVTVAINNINFLSNINLFSSLKLFARPVYSSARLLDVELAVDMIHLDESGQPAAIRVVEGIFSYVGYNKTGAPVQVPPIKLKTDEERERFEERRELHERRKQVTLSNKSGR